jgi:hypothetical protein
MISETDKNLLTAVLILSCLCGCKANEGMKPSDYACTEQEMARVEKESAFCINNTSYFSSYCYSSAMGRACKKKKGNKDAN